MTEQALFAPRRWCEIALPGLGGDAVLLGAAELAFAGLLADPVGRLAVASAVERLEADRVRPGQHGASDCSAAPIAAARRSSGLSRMSGRCRSANVRWAAIACSAAGTSQGAIGTK